MKFGFFLPLSGSLAKIQNVTSAARAAEELGYDHLWVQDRSLTQTRENYLNHLVCGSVEDIDKNENPDFFEPLTTLAALTSTTSKIRLGTSVLQLPLYNPILLSKQVANIDVLSQGRMDFGVGIGTGISYARRGYDNLHFPFGRRGAIFDEYASAIKQLWHSKSPTSFKGKYVEFTDLELFPKPKGLRFLLGSGVGEKGLRRVLDFADGVVLPYRNPSESAQSVAKIREGLRARGRSKDEIDFGQTVYCSIGKTTDEAKSLLYPTINARSRGFSGKAMSTDQKSSGTTNSLVAEDFFEMSLVGRPNEIVRQIERFEKAGVNHLVMILVFRGREYSSLLEAITVFAKEVIPSF